MNMENITISKSEYMRLKRQADAYKKLAKGIFESAVKNPVQDVVDDFKKTDLYSREFLVDLEDGLKKSSYVDKK